MSTSRFGTSTQSRCTRLEIGLRALPTPLRQRSLLPLIHAFAQPNQLPTLTPSADVFLGAVRTYHIGDGRVPSITPRLMRKYVDDLRTLGLLKPTEGAAWQPQAAALPAGSGRVKGQNLRLRADPG